MLRASGFSLLIRLFAFIVDGLRSGLTYSLSFILVLKALVGLTPRVRGFKQNCVSFFLVSHKSIAFKGKFLEELCNLGCDNDHLKMP